MLMRTDPFRELDRIAQQLMAPGGTWSRPAAMPMDAYRDGDRYVLAYDLPGVSPDAIDIDVDGHTLTVKAERRPVAGENNEVRMERAERPLGVFSRQVVLSDNLDIDNIEADYEAGVLTVRIPVTERAKARKITVRSRSGRERNEQLTG